MINIVFVICCPEPLSTSLPTGAIVGIVIAVIVIIIIIIVVVIVVVFLVLKKGDGARGNVILYTFTNV